MEVPIDYKFSCFVCFIQAYGVISDKFALTFYKLGCISTIKTSQLVLYCLRFALTLYKEYII